MIPDQPAPVLAQVSTPGRDPSPWLIAAGRGVPLSHWTQTYAIGRLRSVTALIRDWDRYAAELRALTEHPGTLDAIAATGTSVDDLRFHAPVHPGQTFCTIGNYRAQVIEAAVDTEDGPHGPRAATRHAAAAAALDRRRREGQPYACLTSPARIADPIGDLYLDPGIDTLDWEVEIAAIIGTTSRNLAATGASDAVAGYCVANDLTIRARIHRDDVPVLGTDWLQSKGLPGSLPLGPWFVPAWQIPDPSQLRLRLYVNGDLMQDGTADDMVFDIATQIAYLSRHTTLQPADVVCTGSPAGFGTHHGRYLRPGDVIAAQVSGLGCQHVTCTDETYASTPAPLRQALPAAAGPR